MIVKKQVLIGLAKYGLGIALLAYVIWRYWSPSEDGTSPGLSGLLQRPIQIAPLSCACLLCLASILLTFYRWYILVRAQELPFTIVDAFRLGAVGFYFSNFLPSSIGGDIIKAAFLAKQQARRTVAVATVMVDRGIGLWGLFWLVALSGGIFWLADDPALHSKWALQVVVLFAAGLVAFTSLLWLILVILPRRRARRFAVRLHAIPKVGHSAAEFWRAIWMYRNQWRSLAAALLMSLVSHCGFVLTYYFAARSFLAPDELWQIPSLTEHFLIVPVGMAVQGGVPIPGGIGVGEAAFGKLYGMVAKPDFIRLFVENGVFMSLTYRVITWVWGFLGYLIYLRMRSEVAVAPHELDSETAACGVAEEAATPQAAEN
jgi:uncharacterized protein (TIRG00374 family)